MAEQSLIDAFVDMDAVKISRKFPNRLIIEVTDAVEAYYVSGESGYTVISKGGRILDQNISKESVESGTEVIGLSVDGMKMGSYFDREKDEAFDLLKRDDDAVATAGLSEITKIDIENPVEMSLTYRDKLLIRLGSITELSYKLNFVKNIIETKLEQDEMGVIDATKAGTIHFIPGDLNSEATSSAQTSSGSTGSDGAGVSSEMTESKETSSGAVQAGSDLTTESDSSLAE